MAKPSGKWVWLTHAELRAFARPGGTLPPNAPSTTETPPEKALPERFEEATRKARCNARRRAWQRLRRPERFSEADARHQLWNAIDRVATEHDLEPQHLGELLRALAVVCAVPRDARWAPARAFVAAGSREVRR